MSNKGVFLCFDEEHTENLNKKKDFYNSVCSTKYAKRHLIKEINNSISQWIYFTILLIFPGKKFTISLINNYCLSCPL